MWVKRMKDMENKEKYDPVEYARKYREKHYKLINLSIPVDLFNRISTYADLTCESKEGFVKRCINETIERDKKYNK